jgi:galactonate dehydratase
MKIAKVESLHADAGTRNFDFLKVTTDTGLVGWSEYNETFGGPGLSAVIDRLAPAVVGKDPRAWEAHVTQMYAMRRQSSGGVGQQAIAALENAQRDVKARALGLPVYEMLGGPVRERLRLYWSHCGTYRVRAAQEMQIPPVRSLDDIVKLGKEVVARGYTALKTNVLLFGDNPRNYAPGFARTGEGFPELNPDRYVIKGLQEQLAAFREGAGPDVDILVDLNFNYKTEGFLKMARAMEPFDLLWVEIDTRDPKALHYIRSRAPMPVASCESLFGRRDYRPYIEHYTLDVAIIDTPWNGVGESVKIANMADT